MMLRKLDLGIMMMGCNPELGKDATAIAETVRMFHKNELGEEVQFSPVVTDRVNRAIRQ